MTKTQAQQLIWGAINRLTESPGLGADSMEGAVAAVVNWATAEAARLQQESPVRHTGFTWTPEQAVVVTKAALQHFARNQKRKCDAESLPAWQAVSEAVKRLDALHGQSEPSLAGVPEGWAVRLTDPRCFKREGRSFVVFVERPERASVIAEVRCWYDDGRFAANVVGWRRAETPGREDDRFTPWPWGEQENDLCIQAVCNLLDPTGRLFAQAMEWRDEARGRRRAQRETVSGE